MTRKMIVLVKDRIADVLPSFSAVNQPEENTLYAIIRKLTATIRNPCRAIICPVGAAFDQCLWTPFRLYDIEELFSSRCKEDGSVILIAESASVFTNLATKTPSTAV